LLSAPPQTVLQNRQLTLGHAAWYSGVQTLRVGVVQRTTLHQVNRREARRRWLHCHLHLAPAGWVEAMAAQLHLE
jgi:hypothetical protein